MVVYENVVVDAIDGEDDDDEVGIMPMVVKAVGVPRIAQGQFSQRLVQAPTASHAPRVAFAVPWKLNTFSSVSQSKSVPLSQ